MTLIGVTFPVEMVLQSRSILFGGIKAFRFFDETKTKMFVCFDPPTILSHSSHPTGHQNKPKNKEKWKLNSHLRDVVLVSVSLALTVLTILSNFDAGHGDFLHLLLFVFSLVATVSEGGSSA